MEVQKASYAVEAYADPFFGIMHHNDSENKSGEVTTPQKSGMGPYAVEA